RLEHGVAGDVDLDELEAELAPRILEHSPRALAQMTASRVVEPDRDRYGYSPRVVVASATRITPRPYAAIRMLVLRLSWTSQVSSNALRTIEFSRALTSSSDQKYSCSPCTHSK